ncbi:MAG: autotransporter assembly complex protein TamA [Thiomonas sp.]
MPRKYAAVPPIHRLRAAARRRLWAGLLLGAFWALAAPVAAAAPAPSASASAAPGGFAASAPQTAASGAEGASAGAPAAAASQPSYDVRIDAPEALRGMLAQYLEIERWRFFPGITPTQLRGLVDKIPRQADDLLAAEGYFAPQVKATLNAAARPPLVEVQVQAGEPTRVSSLDLQVNGPDGQPDAPLAAKLRHDWSLADGQVFRSAAWETAKSNALLTLLTQRYPAARIAQSQARVDPKRHGAALSLVLDTGPGYSFGPVQVEGLKRYPETIVQRLAPFQPGQPYAQAKLLEYQQLLQGSSYFRTATVAAPLAEAQGTTLPVQVQVVEYKPQKLGLGVGYSSNTGARTQVDYENLNILGRAWRFTSALKLETLLQSLSAGLAFPRVANGSRYSLSADVQHANIQGLTTRSLILGGQRQRLDGPIDTVLSLQYITERQDVAGYGSTTAQALMPNYSWTRRRLDNPIDPSSGSLVNAQIGAGSKAVLSDQNFIRLVLRGVQYIPLGTRNQLILRGEVGSVLSPSANGIPQQELFRAGGIGSVRGYAYQSLGVTEGDAIVGGRALLTASAEAVHWLTPQWGASVFYDRGDAANSFGALKTVAGYGIGARWRSPAGIISVDLAYGQATQSYRLQFNAGVNF